MATIKQATSQLAPVYNPAVQQIQGQIPAVQQLYNSLIQGLQTQGGTQLSNVLTSADQRGVSRASLASDTQDALNGAIAQQQAPLGVQQASDVAVLQGQVGTTNVARAQAIGNLNDTLQQQLVNKGTNQLEIQKLNRNAALQKEQNQQDFNVKQAAYAKAQADAAARAAQSATDFDPTSISESHLTSLLRVGLEDVKGINKKTGQGDLHVSPEQLAKAYVQWTAAGKVPANFWKNFQGYWNPKQKTYGDDFHYFVNHPEKIKV